MLLELHTATTAYFTYLNRNDAAWNDATAITMRASIVKLAGQAGVTGTRFQRFVAKVAVQVAAA